MPVRATWHTGLEELNEEPERIENVGVVIRLTTDGREAELRTELLGTVEREVRLADRGLTCDIKGTVGVSCHPCPLFDADDLLCQLGRLQERLVTELRVAHVGGRRK